MWFFRNEKEIGENAVGVADAAYQDLFLLMRQFWEVFWAKQFVLHVSAEGV